MFDTSVIYEGDCIEVMKTFPDKCVDLIFADPPYNINVKNTLQRPEGGVYNGIHDEWDSWTPGEYYIFTENWLRASRRILKDTGALWVMGTYHNIHIIGYLLLSLGWFILNDVTWVKSNPTPQFRGVRFCNSIEMLIWCVKYKGCGYTFNYQDMKEYNGGKQMRADWTIPICQGKERIKGADGKKLHSTQKPEKLLERVILSTTKPGDIILDPFFGTGTIGAVAERLGRKWIGIEKESLYIDAAIERISNV